MATDDGPVVANQEEVADEPKASKIARKEPPPEKPSDIRRRSLVILSFWLVVLLLGLPIWWRTTAIYRASLPLEEMLQWAEGKACRPVFPVTIAIQAPHLQEQEALNLVRLTQHALDDLSEFSGHHLRLQLVPSPPAAAAAAAAPSEDIALRIRLTPADANTSSLDPHSLRLNVTYAPNTVPSSAASSSSVLSDYIAAELRAIFSEEAGIISYLLTSAAAPGSANTSNLRIPGVAPDEVAAIAKRTTRALRYAPTYHLTFSLFTAGAVPSSWDIEAAVGEFVGPVLDVLAPIHNFTIDTQVQLYAVPGTQAPVLRKDDLASFVNAAEWPLSPSTGGAPTVNFLLYVGNQTIGLADDGETSQSWLVPQWGTVYLLAPPDAAAPHLPADALRRPMLTFAGHLLSLLGMPRGGRGAAAGHLPIQLSTLSRVRSADLLLRASATLGSLARLARALPSIAIPPSVADGVAKTMAHLHLACASLGGPEGLRHASIADQEAERAFFEKSMVGQLYFPDEHKIAVYLPLIGPVLVPLIIGLINEVKGWRRRRRQRAEDGEAKKAE